MFYWHSFDLEREIVCAGRPYQAHDGVIDLQGLGFFSWNEWQRESLRCDNMKLLRFDPTAKKF
uniref:Uncharacterized protein n=1 Tax=Paenibacillus athensensis TaxID=1967502 RepID=A0A4Y8PSL0_9BACL